MRYAIVSMYLLICFSVILLYDAAQNPSADTPLVLLGVALCKALVIGKFVLLGEALQPGSASKPRRFSSASPGARLACWSC